jgi:hypothetical protein
MAWNHRENVIAVAVAIQAVPGVFTPPSAADIIGVANVTNTRDPVTAEDPTQTGTVWQSPRILIGNTGTVGFNFPMRGPSGDDVPAAGAWPMGRVLRSMGMAEIINAAVINGVTEAGSTDTAIKLAAAAPATDDIYLGAPLQMAEIGTGAIKGTTLITDYDGAGKLASIGETLGAAPAAGVNYTIPKYLSYVLGTLNTPPPLLSISVWRDRKRYDYQDCRPQSANFDAPVGNEYNAGFPSIETSFKGKCIDVAQDTAPGVPNTILQIPVPPAKAGKFALDRVPLGHGGITWQTGTEVGAPSNQNQDDGIDGYEIMSGERTLSLDLNQMDASDFDFQAREDAQNSMPVMSTWGMGPGNRFGLLCPAVVINPLNPGSRNGFVSLTGDAFPTGIDKSLALTIWW